MKRIPPNPEFAPECRVNPDSEHGVQDVKECIKICAEYKQYAEEKTLPLRSAERRLNEQRARAQAKSEEKLLVLQILACSVNPTCRAVSGVMPGMGGKGREILDRVAAEMNVKNVGFNPAKACFDWGMADDGGPKECDPWEGQPYIFQL